MGICNSSEAESHSEGDEESTHGTAVDKGGKDGSLGESPPTGERGVKRRTPTRPRSTLEVHRATAGRTHATPLTHLRSARVVKKRWRTGPPLICGRSTTGAPLLPRPLRLPRRVCGARGGCKSSRQSPSED